MTRPITATVNTNILASNLKIAKNYAPKSKIWSVIKANGYGHGFEAIIKGLNKTDGFALIDINEAIYLREKGWKGPILLLEGFFKFSDLAKIEKYNLTTVVHCIWQVDALAHIYPRYPLHVYVKLNSGMNRLGFSEKIFPIVWSRLKSMNYIANLTLMTHFAFAENLDAIDHQMKIVMRVGKNLIGPKCLANSAATILYPKTHYQWVRPGIMLYGASYNGNWRKLSNLGIKPAMTLSSEIIAIQKLCIGNYIGYRFAPECKDLSWIGIVACGYADGYVCNVRKGTSVLVDGIRTRVLSISMDMLIVDLKPCPKARVGSLVELWGENISIDEVASSSEMISYTLMSRLTSRVKIKVI